MPNKVAGNVYLFENYKLELSAVHVNSISFCGIIHAYILYIHLKLSAKSIKMQSN